MDHLLRDFGIMCRGRREKTVGFCLAAGSGLSVIKSFESERAGSHSLAINSGNVVIRLCNRRNGRIHEQWSFTIFLRRSAAGNCEQEKSFAKQPILGARDKIHF